MATAPTIYTDRSEFLKKVGTYTPLPLVNPVVRVDQLKSSYEATYGNQIKFTFDLRKGVGVNQDGSVILGASNLIASGEVLQSVTAFGFDIVSSDSDSRGEAHFVVDGTDFPVPPNNVSFLGVVHPTPVPMSVEYLPKASGAGDQIGGFRLKNVVVRISSNYEAPSAPTNLKIG